ncbi:MAG: amidohydrolase family protein [Acidimicrobiales bacterium]
MQPEHRAWLATCDESPLDPDIPICDPHHHLWDHPSERYLLEELRADTGAGHHVVRTVFVECLSAYREDGPEELRPVGETEFVRAIAEQGRSSADQGATIDGIVSYADLTLGAGVAAVLEAHAEAGGGLFRGIRHATSWDASPEVHNAHTRPPQHLLTDPAFGFGLDTLGRLGFSFDAWLYHPQLDELAELAAAHPDVPIVLDHLGGPLGVGPYAGRRDEVLERWRPAMARLAELPNLHLKLGGIGMALYGLGWHHRPTAPSSQDLADAWGGVVSWCIERFGTDRCMFESNFPVDRRSCSYTVLWNAFQRMVEDASPTEKADLFHDSASRFYRLDPTGDEAVVPSPSPRQELRP